MKLLIAEPESDVAASLWTEAEEVFSTRLVYPEARSALAAAIRAGRLSPRSRREGVRRLERLVDEMAIIDLDRRLATAAGELADQHALRGYDAVHLASALALDATVPVVTWDQELTRAALAAGRRAAPA